MRQRRFRFAQICWRRINAPSSGWRGQATGGPVQSGWQWLPKYGKLDTVRSVWNVKPHFPPIPLKEPTIEQARSRTQQSM